MLDDYIRNAIHSIGFPTLCAMALILYEDPSVIGLVTAIDKIVEHASAALRLYNDLASLPKEIKTGDKNSVLIVRDAKLEAPNADKEQALLDAQQYILQLANSHAQRCYELVDQLHTDKGQFEETCRWLVGLHAYFYGHTRQDFHTTSLAVARQLLGVP